MKMQAVLTLIVAAVLVGWSVVPAQAELVGYWSFDGSDLTDSSVNGNDGIAGYGGSITYELDTPFGTGLSGENHGGGAANVITVATSPTLEAINDQLTVSFWMKATAGSDWVRIFQHGTEGDPSQTWLIDRYSNTLKTNMRVDTIDDLGPPFVDGQHNQNIATGGADTFDDTWHHIVYMLDDGDYWKYVDGSPAGSGTYKQGAGLSNTRPLYIFGRNAAGNYLGMLDEVGIWDQVLPLSSIQALYDGTANPLTASLPEPSTVAMLLGLAGMGLAGYLRRRRRS